MDQVTTNGRKYSCNWSKLNFKLSVILHKSLISDVFKIVKIFPVLKTFHCCNHPSQVVTSICELVEASFTNIKSGWRPLFGALRAVRFSSHSAAVTEGSAEHGAEHPLAPVCNVFEAFLNTDNAAVFANAAIDCILCLLKFIRATG